MKQTHLRCWFVLFCGLFIISCGVERPISPTAPSSRNLDATVNSIPHPDSSDESITSNYQNDLTASPLLANTPVTTIPSPLPSTGLELVYVDANEQAINVRTVNVDDPQQRQVVVSIERDGSGYDFNASISADGKSIAYTLIQGAGINRNNAELWIAATDGSRQQLLASHVDIGRYTDYPIWSPDSRSIAITRSTAKAAPYERSISIIDVQTGSEIKVVTTTISTSEDEESMWIEPLDWSFDSRYLYYQQGVSKDVQLWSVDVLTLSQEYRNHISDTGIPRCYTTSFDNQLLLCAIPDDVLPSLYDIVTIPISGGKATIFDDNVLLGSDPLWNPGSLDIIVHHLATDDQANSMISINLVTRNTETFLLKADQMTPLGWNLDGQLLVGKQIVNGQSSLVLTGSDGRSIQSIFFEREWDFIGLITSNTIKR